MLAPRQRRRPVILDHDGGVDDLVALTVLACAAAHSTPHAEAIDLIGCVVVDADCFAEEAAECSARVIALAGLSSTLRKRDRAAVPVAISTLQWVIEQFPDDWRKDCINMLDLPCLNHPSVLEATASNQFATRSRGETGEELMARLVLSSEDPVTICVTGPLCNVAHCIQKYGADFTSKIAAVVIMGGAVAAKGNVFRDHLDGSAEWNLYWDCDSAHTVLSTPLLTASQRVLFTLDATNHVPVTSDFVRRFGSVSSGGASPSLLAQFVGSSFAMCTHFARLYGEGRGYYAWDALTAAFVVEPGLVVSTGDGNAAAEIEHLVVDCRRDSPSIGSTRRDAVNGGPVTVPRAIRADAFYDLVLELCAAV